MKKIEFFNASDLELFVDFCIENELNYQESEDGLEWVVEDGEFEIMVGSASSNIRLAEKIEITE